MKYIKSCHAFTLIELLVVISVIALLVGILLPTLSKARGAAREMLCATQVRNYAQAQFTYQADYGTMMPAANRERIDRSSYGGPVWFQIAQNEGYMGSDVSSAVQRCPIVDHDLGDYMTVRFRDEDTNISTYRMNGTIGGWSYIPSANGRPLPLYLDSGLDFYDFKPLSSDDVPDTTNTVLISETASPFDYSWGNDRGSTFSRWFGDIGIPHIQEILPGTITNRSFELPARGGTANMAFADSSVRAQQGEHPDGQNLDRMLTSGDNWDNKDLIMDFLDQDGNVNTP